MSVSFCNCRRKALETILRGFCPNLKQVILYPLSKLVSNLGFEDEADCAR